MKLAKFLSAFALSVLAINLASAAVIDNPDVNGLKTFRDTVTGRVWLDMDNFFDKASDNGTTGLQMIATANAAGFGFATRADVEQLLTPLTLGSGEWAGYAAVMGYGVPRQLIWGMYDDGASPYGWAYAYADMGEWGYQDDATDPTIVQNGGG